MACFIIFPLSIGVISIAKPLIISLLTEQWIGAIVPLQIIACAYILYPIIIINNQPFLCLNKTGLFLKLEIVKKIVAIIFLLVAVNFDYNVLCLSILFYNIFDAIITICYLKKIYETGFLKQLQNISDIIISSISMGIIVYCFVIISPLNTLLTLIFAVFIGLISYCFFNYIIKSDELIILLRILHKSNR